MHTLRSHGWLAAALALVCACLACAAAPANAHAVAGSNAGATALVAAQSSDDQLVAEPLISGANVSGRACVQNIGWRKWVSSGQTIGTCTQRGLRAFRLKLSGLGVGLQGQINYQAFDKGLGWGKKRVGGKSTGRTKTPVQRLRIWLTGNIADHYDVLYRVYIKGQGWQPWVKNKTIAGKKGSSVYVSALQVKLSPKTEEAAGSSITKVGVRYAARITQSGWQAWTGDGKRAGKLSKRTVIDGFALALDTAGLSGGVAYSAYVQDKGWQGWKKSGKTAGASGKRIEALRFKLTGGIAKTYDIYYRSYVYGWGWLDWASNSQVSGSTGLDLPIAGVQVKLVAKGTTVKSAGADTTVNAKRKTRDGIDISSWQAGIDVTKVQADFIIIKATGGTSYTNPYYKLHANAALKAGKMVGFYHFARETSCPGTAVKEADHFIEAVGPYVGRAILVLDWEAGALPLGPSWAKKFLDRVYAKTGVHPLIYMSKNPTNSYNWTSVAKAGYKLWVAQYANYSRTSYQANPWTDDNGYGAWDAPTIFQYTSTGRVSGYSQDLDLDIFYGKEADWAALAKS